MAFIICQASFFIFRQIFFIPYFERHLTRPLPFDIRCAQQYNRHDLSDF